MALPHPGLAQEGGGQERAQDAKHRAQCRLAHQVLTKGQPAVKREWALRYIGSCAQQREVVLEMWEEPPAAREELSTLFELSRKIRDRRIFRRATGIADDASASSDLRVTALGVLGSYLDPDLVMDLSDLERREEVAGIRWSNIFGVGGDLEAQETVRSLPPDAGDRIRALVRRLARGAGDDVVRAQAWHLATRLGLGVEAPR